jgi:hypothetical protein
VPNLAARAVRKAHGGGGVAEDVADVTGQDATREPGRTGTPDRRPGIAHLREKNGRKRG